MVLTAGDNEEQIKAAVVHGNRPPLRAVTGPADLVSFATRWISQCWHQLTEQRPSFRGKHGCLNSQYSHFPFIVIMMTHCCSTAWNIL